MYRCLLLIISLGMAVAPAQGGVAVQQPPGSGCSGSRMRFTAPRRCAAMIQMAVLFGAQGKADHPQRRPSSAWSACASRGRSSAAQGREHQQGASASRDRLTRSSQAVQQPPGAAVAVLHRLTAITDTDPHIQGASGGRRHAEQIRTDRPTVNRKGTWGMVPMCSRIDSGC